MFDGSGKEVFQTVDVGIEIESLVGQLATFQAEAKGERLVLKKGVHPLCEFVAIHPGHQNSVHAVQEPFADAASKATTGRPYRMASRPAAPKGSGHNELITASEASR